MSELKKELILNAAYDITEYLDESFAVDVDPLDIACFINNNLGFCFDVIEENE